MCIRDRCIGLRRKPIADTTKYYVACVTPKGGKYSVGGKYEEMCIRDSPCIQQRRERLVAITPLLMNLPDSE